MIRIGWFLIGVIVIAFAAGGLVYPYLPEQVASHWNIAGEVDGYSGRFVGAFMFPILITVLAILFLVIPKIDPKKQNIEKFYPYFAGFIVVFNLFLLLIFAQTLLWNLGYEISPMVVFPLGFFGLFYYIGIMLEHTEPNWTIGIRTPWTMSSETVWRKTHKLGAKLFKLAGVISLLGIIFQRYAFYLVIGVAIILTVYSILYSYLEFRKEQEKK